MSDLLEKKIKRVTTFKSILFESKPCYNFNLSKNYSKYHWSSLPTRNYSDSLFRKSSLLGSSKQARAIHRSLRSKNFLWKAILCYDITYGRKKPKILYQALGNMPVSYTNYMLKRTGCTYRSYFIYKYSWTWAILWVRGESGMTH